MNVNDTQRWQRPISSQGGPSRMDILRRRHIVRRAVRDYLDSEGFIEIDAPMLVHGAAPEPAIDSFKIEDRYLISSTEYQLKRLEIGGLHKLYSLTQNFRRGDTGRYRNPEFTMLEWGRTGSKMDQIEADAERLTLAALNALELPLHLPYADGVIDMRAPWERQSVAEAIERATGAAMNDFDLPSCRKAAETAGLEIHKEWAEDRDFLFSLVMDHIQPQLGASRPTFLTDWPDFQTASAAPNEAEPGNASRSELFIGGVEIADGFVGVSDAGVQKELFDKALARRAQEGMSPVDLDGKYLESLRESPFHGAGMALGFDRLVMILTGQTHIGTVLAFAWDET
ncbi:MAG: hypothetical protein PHE27_02500 [Alphaproteobacteria bacterium]|nr:hypothetical protein [Alphaproteobacteria bacterium]